MQITELVLSVVIPAFARVEPLKFTLRSVATAARGVGRPVEIVLVDDGSTPPLEQVLAGFNPGWPVRFVRQENQGSIVARLTGLAAARGTFVNFVDSDDLVHPDKFRCQVEAMESSGVEMSYTDSADVSLGDDYTVRGFRPLRTYVDTASSVELFVTVFPCPHSPMFRRDYLDKALRRPVVPLNRLFDPCGDVWLYRNLALHPAAVRHVLGHFAGIGRHGGERFTNCWERLGVAALGIDEAVMAACGPGPETSDLRRRIGDAAFHAFRLLPPDVPAEFEERLLGLWRESPAASGGIRGGRVFRRLAEWIGPVRLARWLRWWRRPRYASCKTLADKRAFERLLEELPPVAA
jgi:hypothetical protein